MAAGGRGSGAEEPRTPAAGEALAVGGRRPADEGVAAATEVGISREDVNRPEGEEEVATGRGDGADRRRTPVDRPDELAAALGETPVLRERLDDSEVGGRSPTHRLSTCP